MTAYEVQRLREDFPLLGGGEHRVVYLDNAATTQKPRTVIDALTRFYTLQNASVHRGIYRLSEQASALYEHARITVSRFIGAESSSEIVFTRGATESINLVAQTFGRLRLGPGDEVLISQMEHHANIVPWQLVCAERGAKVRWLPIGDECEVRGATLDEYLNERTKLVAVAHVSNVIGTVNPIRKIVETAHAKRIPVLVDGAQAVGHLPVDVRELGCDFYAFSGHKMLGPMGIGVLYGRMELLQEMPPWHGGGGAIVHVGTERSVFREAPAKFEAGTPPVAEAIALTAAIEYIESAGRARVAAYERALIQRIARGLEAIPGIHVYGLPHERAAAVSFTVDGVHPHDVSQVLDGDGIAVRAGNLCAQPLMDVLGVPGVVRIAPAFYNTVEEIDFTMDALSRVREVFR
ncbi:MAG: cysteine desulfurase [Candidatus Hydrogenedentes bacterium]|nr:cysteine desulfurase [Candidatus Hydrogenedentota bacterium]